jgi:hypothetical protein
MAASIGQVFVRDIVNPMTTTLAKVSLHPLSWWLGFGLDHLLPRSYHLKQIEATASNVGKNVTFIEMQFEAGLI